MSPAKAFPAFVVGVSVFFTLYICHAVFDESPLSNHPVTSEVRVLGGGDELEQDQTPVRCDSMLY